MAKKEENTIDAAAELYVEKVKSYILGAYIVEKEFIDNVEGAMKAIFEGFNITLRDASEETKFPVKLKERTKKSKPAEKKEEVFNEEEQEQASQDLQASEQEQEQASQDLQASEQMPEQDSQASEQEEPKKRGRKKKADEEKKKKATPFSVFSREYSKSGDKSIPGGAKGAWQLVKVNPNELAKYTEMANKENSE